MNKIVLSEKELTMLKQMAEEEKTIDFAAKSLGYCSQVISKLAKENNIIFTSMEKTKKVILTQEQLTRFKYMAENNYSRKEISQEFGFSTVMVTKIAKKNNIILKCVLKYQKKVLSEEQLAIVRQMAEDGKTRQDIANAIGIKRDVVYRILEEFNIPLTISKENMQGSRFDWTEEKIEKLKEMYNSDTIKFKEIVKYFNCSSSTISKKAAELGIKKKIAYKKPFTEEEIEYLKNNIGYISVLDMAKALNRCDETVEKKLKELGLKNTFSARDNLHKLLKVEGFKEDISNPALSHAFIARKYHTWGGTISKYRKKLFGSFKKMTDTNLCKSTTEMDFEDILCNIPLSYIYQQKIGNWKVDYDLGFKLLVEIQGLYWHTLSDKHFKRDKKKVKELTEAGYTVLVFWEDELQNKNLVKEKVLTALYKNIQSYYGSLNLVNSKIEVSA